MEGTIRKAEERDAVDVAKLCFLAGKSHVEFSVYDLMVPGPPGMTDERIDTLAGVISAEAQSWISYIHYQVVEAEGRVASGLATFTVEESGDEKLGAALIEIGWQISDLIEMGKRFEVWEATDTGRAPGYLIVEDAATFEEFRHRGYTSALLEQAAEQARAGAFPGLQLTVMLGNDPAVRVYEKAGFKMDTAKENPDFEKIFGSPGVGRMLLDF